MKVFVFLYYISFKYFLENGGQVDAEIFLKNEKFAETCLMTN